MSVRSQQIKEKIEWIIKESLVPTFMEIEDESWKHEGHAASKGGGHFQLTVVSNRFEGVNLINRNRIVFDTLKDLMHNEIHALSIKARTPEEWSEDGR
ncbi:MAG: BolA family protein [Nitrospiria bacterium]